MSGLDSLGVWGLARTISALEQVKQGDPVTPPKQSGSVAERGSVIDLLDFVLTTCSAASIRTRNLEHVRILRTSLAANLPMSGIPRSLDPKEAEQIHRLAYGLRTELEVLLEQRKFAEPSEPEGLINYQKLRTSSIAILVDDTKAIWSLPGAIQSDLKESAEALNAKVPTGATMLALRAAEGMVREAHAWFFPGDDTQLTWDEMVKAMKPRLDEVGVRDPSIESYLHYLRVSRNRAQHPGESFSQKDAERALQDAARLAVILLPLKDRVETHKTQAKKG